MKTLTAILLIAATAYAQTPGSPCTTPGGNPGTYANTAQIGQTFNLVCISVHPIPLDNQWMSLYGNGIQSIVGANYIDPYKPIDPTVPGAPNLPVNFELSYWGFDNPSFDGNLIMSSLPGGTPSPTMKLMAGTYCCYLYRPFQAGYVPGAVTVPMQIGGTLTFTIQLTASPGATIDISGDTGYNLDGTSVNSCTPAYANPHVIMTSAGSESFSWPIFNVEDNDVRWYGQSTVNMSDAAGHLIPGTYFLTQPVDPATWWGVYGGNAYREDGTVNPGFTTTIAQPSALGFGLGGGCFAAHGWKLLSGTASVVVLGASYRAP